MRMRGEPGDECSGHAACQRSHRSERSDVGSRERDARRVGGRRRGPRGWWWAAGARSAPEPVNGIAHLLEHMAFKGTGRRSAQLIAEEIEAVGGYLDAYTTREHTHYYTRSRSE